ncbi:MAG: ATP-binding cassette domain-containing protein [Patescibacteria group bacterium]|nr:ATP-binding cassette domain-containing protein [Patescibacteria group bacterium]
MIKFKRVTQKFPNETLAFADLSFNVEDGEIVTITGPSGSGKTTIMRLLIREYEPSEGEIVFDGQKLQEINRRQIPHHRRRIGVVFQDYKLIEDLNVWENIALPLNIKGKQKNEIENRVTDLLKLVELEDKALMFPCQLSGGESQRISIARALATGPKIIFADEPTGNLDKNTGLHIIKLLQKINELGTTVLLATHDPFILEEFKLRQIDLAKLGKSLEKETEKKETEKENLEEEKARKQKKKAEKKNQKETKADKKNKEDTTQEKKPSFFKKLFARKKTEPAKEKSDGKKKKEADKKTKKGTKEDKKP